MNKQPATFLSLRLIHWVILLASIGLTFLVWLVTSYQTDRINQAKFNREANHVVSLIQERMDTYVDALSSGAAYVVAANNRIDHKSWRKYTEKLKIEKKYKGINGMGVIYVVAKKNKKKFLNKQRAEGNKFTIYPKHDHDTLLPITFIEPLEINKNALGLDVAHEKNRLQGAEQAKKTGMATVTGPIVLVQDDKKTPGFLLYVPLYKNEYGQKGKQVHGFVYAPFIVYKLMNGVLAQEKRYVNLVISDNNQVIFKDTGNKEQASTYTARKKIKMYGRVWDIQVWPTQQFLATMDASLPLYVLIAGCIIDLSLLILFMVMARSHKNAIDYGEHLTKKLKKIANDDYLTSLPNRMFFIDEVDKAMQTSEYDKLAILYLDLDNFKNINDNLGHTFGDELLIEVANRMRTVFAAMKKDKAHLARIGGDEFAILLCDEDIENYSQHVAKKILHALDDSFLIQSYELHINCSIGIATAGALTEHEINSSEKVKALLRYADIAMYDAKDRGKNQYSMYDEFLSAASERKSSIELQLHNTVSRNQIHMVYQPIFESGSLNVYGIESLVRWHSSELGDVGPMEFIPIAEKIGFMINLGWRIFELVFKQIMQWEQTGHAYSQCVVTINCSPLQLEDRYFLSTLISMMRKYRIDPSRIVLEITETAIMDNIDDKIKILDQLVQEGINIAIDDFGTGYSSLNYLENLPVKFLKIDQSFVARIQDKKSNKMIDNIIKISRACDVKIIAEGVENQVQLRYLTLAGCDYLQGFYFNK